MGTEKIATNITEKKTMFMYIAPPLIKSFIIPRNIFGRKLELTNPTA